MKGIGIIKVTENDCGFLWSWRNHPRVRKYFFRTDPIPWEEHREWFSLKVKDPNTKIYIAKLKSERIGVIRFEAQEGFIRVSVNLNPNFIGRGLGPKLIRLGTERILNATKASKPVIAEIREDNIPSQKAFSKAGYMYVESGRERVIYKKER